MNAPPTESSGTLRAWWICLLAACLTYGLPVIVGSSWFPTPIFPPRTDGSRQPAYKTGYDTFSFRYFDLPYREMAQKGLAVGELPLWNPNSWLGVPMPAQYQNQVFSPLEWVDWLGGNRWWNLTLILRISLGGLGTFLFVRRFLNDDVAGLAAGIIYQFSGYLAGFQSVTAFLNGAATLPWLFLAIECAFNSRSKPGSVCLIGGAFGLAAVNGQPQIAILNFAATGVFAIFALVGAPDWSHRRRGMAVLIGGGLVAVAAASPQLAAFHEGLQNSYTIHSPGTYAGGGTNPLNLVLPFMPLLLGPMMSPWMGSLFPSQVNHEGFPVLIGAALTAAFFLGLIHAIYPAHPVTRKQRLYLGAFLLLLTAVLAVVICGTFGWANLWKFPLANQINIPRYSAPLLALIITVVAVAGLRSAVAASAWRIMLALAATITMVALLHKMAWAALTAPAEATNLPLRKISILLAEASGWTSLLAMALILARRARRFPDQAIMACGLLIVAELSLCVRYGFAVNFEYWRLVPWAALVVAAFAWAWQARRTAWAALSCGSATLLVLCLASPRFLEKSRQPFLETERHVQFLQTAVGQESRGGRVLTSQRAMIPDVIAAFDVAQINGVNPVQPNLASQWFRSALATRPLNYTLPVSWYGMVEATDWPGWKDYAANRLLYNFIGIRFLVESRGGELTSLQLTETRVAFETPQYRIIEDLRAWPRAFVAEGKFAAAPSPEIAQQMALDHRQDANFPEMAIVAPSEIVASLQNGAAGVRITPASIEEFRPQYVRLSSTSVGPSLLVLTDIVYPGWRAWVDGIEKPIYATQGLVRGVPLSAGPHRIEFRYQPAWLWPCLGLAGLAWLTIAICGFTSRD